VTNVGSDRAQLASLGRKAREATGCEEITVVADRGYYNGDEVPACEGSGVLPCVPKTLTSGNAKRGPLHLPGGPIPDEREGSLRPPGQYRPLPQPHGLSDLHAQTQMHVRQVQAREARSA
jgi:hypothetical protein